MLQYFTAIGLVQSFTRLVLAHAIICTPYAIRSVGAFSFITSFDNVVVSTYLIGADTVTLPIRIGSYSRRSQV